MTEKIIYIAADGKEFDNEKDCREYENTSMLKGIHCYNGSKQPITLSINDFRSEFCSIYYVQAESKEALDHFNDISEDNGYEPIPYEDLGAEYDDLFYYSDDDDCWHSLRDEIKKLKDLADHFQVFFEYEY